MGKVLFPVGLAIACLSGALTAQTIEQTNSFDAKTQPFAIAAYRAASPVAASVAEKPGVTLSQPKPTVVLHTGFGSKLTYYLGSTVSARNFLETGFIAGIPNLPSAPKQPSTKTTTGPEYEAAMDQYGDDMDVWRRSSEDILRYHGRRAAVGLATAETRAFFSNFLLPVALRQNARYTPAELNNSFGRRIGHAAASVIVTQGNNGHLQPNISKIAGTIGAAFMGREVYTDQFNLPQLHTNKFVGKYIAYSLAGDAATNVARELVRSMVRSEILQGNAQGASLSENYTPLSPQAKFVYWAKSTYSMRNFAQGALMAGIPNITDEPSYPATPVITSEEEQAAFDNTLKQYGDNVQAWRHNLETDVRYHGRRLVAGIAESETQLFLSNFLLAAPLKLDPRYIPLGPDHAFGARLGHAIAGVAVTHRDNGRRFMNLPLIGGTVGAAYIGKQLIYPEVGVDRLSRDEVLGRTIGLNLAVDVIYNILQELRPRRTF